jgi:dihydroxy-acid dehydratase
MGTASTMACLLVALGVMPIQGATAAAVSSARLRIAESTGTYAAQLAKSHLQPQTILTRESFLNAITVLQAIGGSTNAIVHLMAIINRHPALAGTITPATIDSIGRQTPLLVDLKPSGENYMTDFHNAGGMPALLHTLKPLLHLDALTVTGRTLGEELAHTPFRPSVLPQGNPANCIRPLDNPLYPSSALVIFQRGNLSPGGAAVMKASASKDRRLLKHRGRAVVFNGSGDLAARIDDPELDVDRNSVLVLRGIGPVGNPGMPEAGMIPIPRKLAAQGVVDMLRISDGRMSGTAGGTIVLHISPEGADPGSVLGVLKDGDVVVCDVEERVLSVELDEVVIRQRMEQRNREMERIREDPWVTRGSVRGYRGLYMREVKQAEHGVDFGFLTAAGPESTSGGNGGSQG